ncbi:MAG TPA: FkbM family methyltransferase [Nitrososphaeraceae archaeon]|nr:FkbM family methyltransferase [Nitrososphaeraceae archaeon]
MPPPFSISVVQKYISWLKKSEGVTISDKILIFFIKLVYISLRFVLLALGRKRRSKIIEEQELDYGTLWNKFYYKFSGRNKKNDDSQLLKFKMPKYNYEFYCRKNKDDFQIMTFHEDELIEHNFTPREGDIVIDVGAHIGPYTLKASRHVGLNGKVIAIEADPENFKLLKLNIQLNKLTNVIALNYAVYSKEDKIKLYLPSKEKEEESSPSYTKYNTIMTERVDNEKKFVEVKANTLDYLLQSNGIKHEQVNWIKIDVEGAEYEVLKGSKDILDKSNNISLLIEVHNLSSNINLYEPIKEFLNSYNFKIDFEKVESSGERHIIVHKHQ